MWLTSQSCDLPAATPQPSGRAEGEPDQCLECSLATGGEGSTVSVMGLWKADPACSKCEH